MKKIHIILFLLAILTPIQAQVKKTYVTTVAQQFLQYGARTAYQSLPSLGYQIRETNRVAEDSNNSLMLAECPNDWTYFLLEYNPSTNKVFRVEVGFIIFESKELFNTYMNLSGYKLEVQTDTDLKYQMETDKQFYTCNANYTIEDNEFWTILTFRMSNLTEEQQEEKKQILIEEEMQEYLSYISGVTNYKREIHCPNLNMSIKHIELLQYLLSTDNSWTYNLDQNRSQQKQYNFKLKIDTIGQTEIKSNYDIEPYFEIRTSGPATIKFKLIHKTLPVKYSISGEIKITRKHISKLYQCKVAWDKSKQEWIIKSGEIREDFKPLLYNAIKMQNDMSSSAKKYTLFYTIVQCDGRILPLNNTGECSFSAWTINNLDIPIIISMK